MRLFLQDIGISSSRITGKTVNFAGKAEKKSAGNFTGM
jgi:hypothetical protein